MVDGLMSASLAAVEADALNNFDVTASAMRCVGLSASGCPRLSDLRPNWVPCEVTVNVDIAPIRYADAISEQLGVRCAAAVLDVAGVDDLLLWDIASDDANCSVEVELTPDADADALRREVASRLEVEFGIHQASIQTEREACEDTSSLHP